MEVLVRNPDKPLEEAVKDEAEKGYDLLFIGVDNAKKERRWRSTRTFHGSP